MNERELIGRVKGGSRVPGTYAKGLHSTPAPGGSHVTTPTAWTRVARQSLQGVTEVPVGRICSAGGHWLPRCGRLLLSWSETAQRTVLVRCSRRIMRRWELDSWASFGAAQPA